jgi:GNAT superfamily N-acetyltransferase
MQIIRAAPNDAEALTAIAFAAKRHWGYPETWIEAWRDALTVQPESIRDHNIHMAIVDKQIVGFYGLSQQPGKLLLEDLWVLPAAMGKGVGRQLFAHALAQAQARGFATIEIESDPNAEGFYLKMGSRRIALAIREVAGCRRELPVLICSTPAAWALQ